MRIVKQEVGPCTYRVKVTECDAIREQSTDTDATIREGDFEVVILNKKGKPQKPPEDELGRLKRSHRNALVTFLIGVGLASAGQAFTAWTTGVDREIETRQTRAGIEKVLTSPPTDEKKNATVPEGNKIPDKFIWTKSE